MLNGRDNFYLLIRLLWTGFLGVILWWRPCLIPFSKTFLYSPSISHVRNFLPVRKAWRLMQNAWCLDGPAKIHGKSWQDFPDCLFSRKEHNVLNNPPQPAPTHSRVSPEVLFILLYRAVGCRENLDSLWWAQFWPKAGISNTIQQVYKHVITSEKRYLQFH